jgi:outer membrane receptor protein involved in Fe transport
MCSPFRRNIPRSNPSADKRAGALAALSQALAVVLGSAAAHAQVVSLDPIVVSTDRGAVAASQVANTVAIFTADELKSAPVLTADEALRSAPSFSLFRRNDSLTANPTTQGVSLRGLGPSGASRSLVLLDGLPLNDPFGGWITWSQVPREGLYRVEIVPAGGAAAWGDNALGGVIQLFTSPPAAGGSLSAWAGDFTTRGAELRESVPLAGGFFELSGQDFATDGTRIVAPAERGSVDIPAASKHHWVSGKWTGPVGPDLTVTLSGRAFNERRDNGTPYQVNSTRTQEAALQVEGRGPGAFNWSSAAYAQDEVLNATFSSVNAARTSETPASIQFDVPASASGAEWHGTWTGPSNEKTTAGVDARQVRGETREDYQYTAGNFTRQRFAGGKQSFAGLYVLREQPLASRVHASVGARIDHWDQWGGHRRETDLGTGAVLRDDWDSERQGFAFSPTAGAVWEAAPGLRLRASGQRSYRAPTLNELYRPFRQGANVTEANPALANETALSGEIAADYRRGIFTGSVAGFVNELHHAVGNVTVAQGPSTTPLFGTLAAGASGIQRLNLDRIRVRGLESTLRLALSPQFEMEMSALLNDARVEAASVSPRLVGKQLAEVPKWGASAGATWHPLSRLTVTPRVRFIGRQFDDDLNQLPLASATVADLGFRLQLNVHVEVFVNIQNVTDATVETSHSAAGVFGQDTSRLAFGGLRFGW